MQEVSINLKRLQRKVTADLLSMISVGITANTMAKNRK
jgi:hypothetical protein